MVLINKSEKEAIIAKYPNIGIVRTMIQRSKRHRYYMEERKDAMAYLRTLRGEKHAYRNRDERGVVNNSARSRL